MAALSYVRGIYMYVCVCMCACASTCMHKEQVRGIRGAHWLHQYYSAHFAVSFSPFSECRFFFYFLSQGTEQMFWCSLCLYLKFSEVLIRGNTVCVESQQDPHRRVFLSRLPLIS